MDSLDKAIKLIGSIVEDRKQIMNAKPSKLIFVGVNSKDVKTTEKLLKEQA